MPSLPNNPFDEKMRLGGEKRRRRGLRSIGRGLWRNIRRQSI